MVEGHNFSVWREPNVPDVGWGKIWARCHCGFECFGTTYDEVAWQTAEHFEEAIRLLELEREEADA